MPAAQVRWSGRRVRLIGRAWRQRRQRLHGRQRGGAGGAGVGRGGGIFVPSGGLSMNSGAASRVISPWAEPVATAAMRGDGRHRRLWRARWFRCGGGTRRGVGGAGGRGGNGGNAGLAGFAAAGGYGGTGAGGGLYVGGGVVQENAGASIASNEAIGGAGGVGGYAYYGARVGFAGSGGQGVREVRARPCIRPAAAWAGQGAQPGTWVWSRRPATRRTEEPAAPGFGGGVYLQSGLLTFDNASLSSNEAIGGAGGAGGVAGNGDPADLVAAVVTERGGPGPRGRPAELAGPAGLWGSFLNGGVPAKLETGARWPGCGGGLYLGGGLLVDGGATITLNVARGGAGGAGGWGFSGGQGGCCPTARRRRHWRIRWCPPGGVAREHRPDWPARAGPAASEAPAELVGRV